MSGGRSGRPSAGFEGYLESQRRSPDYPGADTCDEHRYHTRADEQVSARVTRSEAPTVLEQDREGKTFSRHGRYTLSPSASGTSVLVEDEVGFKGPGKLAAPIASRDIRRRWGASLENLKAAVEREPQPI